MEVSAPIAARLAFGITRKKVQKNVLIFDFGGTNCEVSYLPYENDNVGYFVRASLEKQKNGGRQITSLIVDHCI